MREGRRVGLSVIAAWALLAAVVIPVFPHINSPNQFTRWATAAAIVEYHTFEVTRLEPLLGEGFEDLSRVDGRDYSNKAPGAALLGLPAYAFMRMVVGPPSAENMRVTLTAMRLLASTLPVLLLAIAFAGLASGRALPLIALLFGTPLFAYGMLNFSHALTAAALFGAWMLLHMRPAPRRDVLAGALIGIAVTSEYPAVLAAAVIVAFATGERSLLRIVAGGLPFAIALALYNRAIFGSFFALSSGFERDPAFRKLAARGLFGIGVPDPMVMLRLLFDPSKGLLVFSPVLILAIAVIPAARASLRPRQFWSLTLAPLVIFLTYAGYPNWHGGWTVGARYLVPALPFLAFLLVFVPGRLTPVLTLLTGASIAAVTTTSLVFPFIPPGVPAPWGTFGMPLLGHGLVAPNVFHLIARPMAIAVPLIAVLAVMLMLERRALAFAGAAAMLVIGLLVPATPMVMVERGFIEEVSFERDGALARSQPAGMTINPALIRRAHEARTLPPTSWPF